MIPIILPPDSVLLKRPATNDNRRPQLATKQTPKSSAKSKKNSQSTAKGSTVSYSSTSKPSNPKDIVGIRKAPMSTVSATVLAEVGVAMLEGASKYGRHNYRFVGVRCSVYYDATMRHLMTWWEGEDLDADSGMSHITKAITALVVLRDAMIQGMVEDDRPPKSIPFYPQLNALAGEIIDKYKDKNPVHYTALNVPTKVNSNV